MASSGQQHKISPRKFSEKIALLNRKEAEGNAEFEEIIKEVQATKSGKFLTGSSQKYVEFRRGPNGRSNDKSNNEPQQQSRTNDNAGAKLTKTASLERQELEQVFENLIECVGQYEEELLEEADKRRRLGAETIPESRPLEREANEEGVGQSAASGFPKRGVICQTLPENQSTCPDRASFGGGQVGEQAGIPYGAQSSFTTGDAQQNSNTDEGSFYGFDGGGGGGFAPSRARVVSFGSAINYKYICNGANNSANITQTPAFSMGVISFAGSNNSAAPTMLPMPIAEAGQVNAQTNAHHNQATRSLYNCQEATEAEWPAQANEMYLKVSGCDRSWQKSSSDPALHAPYAPPIGGLSNCAHQLAPNARQVEQDQQQAIGSRIISAPAPSATGNTATSATSAPIRAPANFEEQQENVGPMQVATFAYQQQQQQQFANGGQLASQSVMGNCDKLNYLSDNVEKRQVAILKPQFAAHQQPMPEMYVSNNGQRELMAATMCDESMDDSLQEKIQFEGANEEMANYLPGINICPIDDDDESLDQLMNVDTHQGRFTSNDSAHLPASLNEELSSRNSSLPDIANLQFEPASDKDALAAVQQQRQQQVVDTESGEQHWLASNQSANVQQHLQATTEWPVIARDVDHQAALYAPKVNSLLSSSDCALIHNQAGFAAEEFYSANNSNNIIRSRSHNSIDYLTKQRLQNTSAASNCSGIHAGQALIGQQANEPNQFHANLTNRGQSSRSWSRIEEGLLNSQERLAGGQQLAFGSQRCASVSPAGSSSNLASPAQSEQNSPASQSGDYHISAYSAISHSQPDHQLLSPEPDHISSVPAETAPLSQQAPYHQSQYHRLQSAASMQQQHPNHHHHHQQHQNQHHRNTQSQLEGSIGPCQSRSSSRRLHNQACYGDYHAAPARGGGQFK